jgi:hypothetical protein
VELQWCYGGVTDHLVLIDNGHIHHGLQKCYSGDAVVVQWCYCGDTVVLKWCYSDVTEVPAISMVLEVLQ